MRLLTLTIVVALALTRPLAAAIVCVQPTAGLPVPATQCAGTPTACTYTMPSQPTGGNALIVSVSFGSLKSITSVADSLGGGINTYASTTKAQTPSGSQVQVWYATAITTAASFTVTAHQDSTGSLTVFVAEYSGIQTALPVDKQVQGNGSSTTPAVASTTATNANSLYVAAIVHDGAGTITISGGGSFTERGEAETTTNQTQGYEDIVSSAAQTGPFTLGSSAAWADTMVIFIPDTGAAAPPTRSLLGVGKAAH